MNSSGSKSLHNNVQHRLLPFPKRRSVQAYLAVLSGVALASLSSIAVGLGLGELDSASFLGQPLRANIELVSLEGDLDLNSLIVRQVTVDEARKMGVEAFYAPYRIDFVIDTSTGSPRVQVTSQEPINEPYLSLMVELRWPKGVVYREYPLLLDPPPLVPARNTPAKAASRPQPVAQPEAQPQARSTSAAAAPVQINLEALDTEDGSYRVKPGDTLSKIAERWREGTTQGISETMQWLHQNNSHAFANNNINRLLAGATLRMPDLSAYKAAGGNSQPVTSSIAPLPETGSGESASAELSASTESAPEHNRFGDDAARAEGTQGLLTLGTENRDDKTRELIDMLVRENETLKARMEKIESSEYLDTLKQLIVLQRQQISDLREKLGVPDSDADEEMDALFSEIGVNRIDTSSSRAAEAPVATAPAPVVEVVQERPEAVLEVDPVMAQPAQSDTGRSWLVWLMFGAGLALSALFVGMFTYYRRMVPAPNKEEKTGEEFSHFVAPVAHEPRREPTLATFKPARSPERAANLDYDGELTPIYVHKKKNEDNWLGEKAESADAVAADFDATLREVQEAFEDMVLDEDALKSLDGIGETPLEEVTVEMPAEEPAPPARIEPVVETKEKTVKPAKKGKKDHSTRRPDEEVRMSIAEKMAQYNPEEYRQEIENLGLLELDELAEIEESDEEDVDTIVYRAMMFCEFKKFDKARNLVETKMQTIHDARLSAALEQIDSLYNEAQKDSKKAI